MKNFLFILILLFFAACDNRSKFGFSSGNCNEVYQTCMNKCIQDKPRNECIESCSKSRGMCQAVKTKGCMQDCNKNYGKNSQQAETCKKRCVENGGNSY